MGLGILHFWNDDIKSTEIVELSMSTLPVTLYNCICMVEELWERLIAQHIVGKVVVPNPH